MRPFPYHRAYHSLVPSLSLPAQQTKSRARAYLEKRMRLVTTIRQRLAVLALAPVLLAACAQGGSGIDNHPTPTPTPGPIVGEAKIDSANVSVAESNPVQVTVTIAGSVPDSCTTLDPITPQRSTNLFRIQVTTKRPADALCAQVITPFEQNVSLDVAGMQAGIYTVDVNGVTANFTLPKDVPSR